MFSGASGPLNEAGLVFGATVSVGVAAIAIGDDPETGWPRVKVRSSGPDVVLGTWVVLITCKAASGCSVEALLPGFPCGIWDVAAGSEALGDEFLGASSTSAPGNGAEGGAVRVGSGALSGWPVGMLEESMNVSVVVGGELATNDVGDGSLGDTGFSAVSNAIERVRAPPVLCATPVRGSGVED